MRIKILDYRQKQLGTPAAESLDSRPSAPAASEWEPHPRLSRTRHWSGFGCRAKSTGTHIREKNITRCI